MKTSSRLSIVASLVAALCIAPAAFAKPKGDDQQGPEGNGKPGKSGKHGKSGAQAGPGAGGPGAGPSAPGGGQQQGRVGIQPHGPGGRGPGGIGIVIVPPPLHPPQPPPPRYRRTYQTHSDYADSNVAAVQRALKTRGYYTGPVDGDAGSGTRAAIRGFREDNGLDATSRIDDQLLRALGL